MSDPMTPEELQACRERAEALRATDPETIEPDNFAEACHTFMDHVVADVPRLLATIAARDARLEAVADVLRAHGCECGCDCDGHDDDCDPCLGCRIEAAMKGASQ